MVSAVCARDLVRLCFRITEHPSLELTRGLGPAVDGFVPAMGPAVGLRIAAALGRRAGRGTVTGRDGGRGGEVACPGREGNVQRRGPAGRGPGRSGRWAAPGLGGLHRHLHASPSPYLHRHLPVRRIGRTS